jgi:hypothetical protein
MGGTEAVLTLSMATVMSFSEPALGAGRPSALAACGLALHRPTRRHHGVVDLRTAGRRSFASSARRLFGGQQRPRQRDHNHAPSPKAAYLPRPAPAPVEACVHGFIHTCRPSRERHGITGRQFRCSRKSLRNRTIVQAEVKSLGVLVGGEKTLGGSPGRPSRADVHAAV